MDGERRATRVADRSYRAKVYIYRPGQQPETLHKPEALEGEGPIAGFRLEIERFWA